jgi:hypothetical protein
MIKQYGLKPLNTMLVLLSSALLSVPAMAMQAISDQEMSDIVGQALFYTRVGAVKVQAVILILIT